ncbi:glycosyltransferase family 32 protein [Telmatospirillum siberiense]|uniref:Glycosyl transferase n=1 Tax=Telmatospirillum siberiense TaxID=382514 RepID=A0A2N3Q069_9PROT|nr:glycosyltransferase [Telmatospirillum siberiense]PKU26048.1 hypothetical protein CWS72_02605 [Telmatospirillum siberiense]
MIPRQIHRIWFGPSDIPEEYENWWNAWQRQFPSYEFTTWGDDNVKDFSSITKIREADSPARKADVARYEILYRHGGIYLDCDMMPLNYFDHTDYPGDLLLCDVEPGTFCSNAFMASTARNPTMKRASDAINQMSDINENPPNHQTGPFFLGRLLQEERYTELPAETFYPYGFDKPFSSIWEKDLGKVFGIHVWGGSWASDEQKILKSVQKLLHSDATESENMLKYFPECGAKTEIINFVRELRNFRRNELRLAKNALLGHIISPTNPRYFDLFKTCSYLLTTNPSAILWQLGAGDGIRNNALRPVMINYDPTALLAEADTVLFQKLEKNYSNNNNVKIVNATPTASKENNKQYQVDISELLSYHENKCPDVISFNEFDNKIEIFNRILLSGTKPLILEFCYSGMQDFDKWALQGQLIDEYHLINADSSLIAYRKDFFSQYCESLFVDYGFPNIFRDCLKVINGF